LNPAAEAIRLERVGRVAVATLSRAPVNALDEVLVARLDAMLDEIVNDDRVALLHIRSEQKAFCAGADLALMRSCLEAEDGPEIMLKLVSRMQWLFERIEALPLVTLAEIGGAALGGGMELALACDLRVAATQARIGLPEVGLGLVPGAGGTQRLTRLCGRSVAKRLILGAETIDGAEAERLGLVQWVRPREELADWTRQLAARIAALPKAALAMAKDCIAAQGDPGRDGFAEEIAASRRLYHHPETRSKVSEFLNRNATQGTSKETS
jgi:enoyl-CoA hydratase/carnithine racemase